MSCIEWVPSADPMALTDIQREMCAPGPTPPPSPTGSRPQTSVNWKLDTSAPRFAAKDVSTSGLLSRGTKCFFAIATK